MVSHVHVGHGPGLYALARGVDREYLSCDRCGLVTTVDPAALDGVRTALHADFGHHARFSHFPIHGLCAELRGGGPGARPPPHALARATERQRRLGREAGSAAGVTGISSGLEADSARRSTEVMPVTSGISPGSTAVDGRSRPGEYAG